MPYKGRRFVLWSDESVRRCTGKLEIRLDNSELPREDMSWLRQQGWLSGGDLTKAED
jgi:hypothetical protein